VIFGSIGIFVFSLIAAGFFLKTEFMPMADQGQVTLKSSCRRNQVDETMKIARKIDAYIDENFPEKDLVSTSAGSYDDAGFAALFTNSGSNIINITLALVTSSEENVRCRNADNLRSYLATIPEIVKFSCIAGQGGMATQGNTVDVEIYGYDFNKLRHWL